ncbi:MAG: hypothetical protein HXY20_05725, partial [Acidobacteria bacterium]|nr:hypothetical protein [Acidobacteriota bacterium]
PTPFYLLPHIGGSSTLRGFNLDRFYGKSILLFSLEYRYRLHPNYQTFLFRRRPALRQDERARLAQLAA